MQIFKLGEKIIFHLLKLVCKVLFYINHRAYMRAYIPLLKMKGVKIIGKPRYIGIHVIFDDYRMISIGDKTTISDDCHLLTHDYSITNAFRCIGVELKTDIAIVREISIGNNCFIGKKSIILPNCEIDDNCIIGAGSVVRGKIPSNSLVVGNPAKIIGTVTNLAKKWDGIDKKYIRID